ncbi:MAG: CidA/LrgA family protein [Burkholderiaceae bacterium]|nr:CidA/LrgA family protein [Burkholderiaceae bacterium]
MLRTFATLLVFQSLGEAIRIAGGLPVPGPVIGMALLVVWLFIKPAEAGLLRDDVRSLLSHLSLLFVPAGVGVMLHAHRLADEALAIGVALVLSTIAAIVVTAVVVDRVGRWLGLDDQTKAEP